MNIRSIMRTVRRYSRMRPTGTQPALPPRDTDAIPERKHVRPAFATARTR